jgi:hypothetical protein
MKKAYIIISSFFGLTIMFTLFFYFSYRIALNHFNANEINSNVQSIQDSKQDFGPLPENIALNGNTSFSIINRNVMDSMTVDTSKIDTITPYTNYVLEIYDIKTDTVTKTTPNTPEFLIGLTREEVIEYLHQFMLDMPLNEFQQGLISYELVSFSEDKVVLRKSYNSDNIKYEYFMIINNGYVTVYYSDKKTVYEYTNIESKYLPEDEIEKLHSGIYVKDQKELYSILESYSS